MSHSRDIKPDPYRAPTREEIARARDMYAQGFTVSRILAATDMSLGTLYYWLDGGVQEEGVASLPPIPRRKLVVGKRRRALKTDSISLTARLWRTAERQVRDVEERLALPQRSGPERERDVRMLSVLTRTLRDLTTIDRLQPPGDLTEAKPVDDDLPPEDQDEFRIELTRRIHAIIAAKKDEAAMPVQPEAP